MTKLTKAQRARLDKLATYLESLPKGYRHFDMFDYIELLGDDTAAERQYALKNGGVPSCGTVACAVGHGPAAGILFKPSMITRRSYGDGWCVDWNAYATLFVGGDECDDEFPAEPYFSWLFAGSWRHGDNHHWGAAARIRYLLAKGDAPAEYDPENPHTRKIYAPYRIKARKPLAGKAPANA